MKIIFLIDSFFSKRDYERYGLEIILNNSIEVFFWDVSNLNQNKTEKSGLDMNLLNKKSHYQFFENFQELEEISNSKGFFLIDLRTEINKSVPLNFFREKGIIPIVLDQGLLPISFRLTLIDNFLILINKFLDEGIMKTINHVPKKIYNSFTPSKNLEYYDIKVCSGSISKCNNGEFEIKSHAYDYDLFLKKKNNVDYHNKIVFLDSGMTGHPDDFVFNKQPACSKEKYFPMMQRLFNQIESQTRSSVVISIHPRVKINSELILNYGNRELVQGNSLELIAGAKFVLAHNTTSINFAILLNIPLIIITTSQIERRFYSHMQSLSNILSVPRINIDKAIDKIDFFQIAQSSLSQYNEYLETFIKSPGTPNQNSAEILIQGLKKYVQ